MESVRECVLSRVWLFVTPWTVTCQAPLSMRFPKQEYWNGCHFLLQGIPVFCIILVGCVWWGVCVCVCGLIFFLKNKRLRSKWMKYKRLYAYLIDLTWTQYILQYQIHSSVLLTSLLMDWFQSISLEITFIFPMLVFRHTCSSLGANTFNNTINLLVIFSSFSLIIIIFFRNLENCYIC